MNWTTFWRKYDISEDNREDSLRCNFKDKLDDESKCTFREGVKNSSRESSEIICSVILKVIFTASLKIRLKIIFGVKDHAKKVLEI